MSNAFDRLAVLGSFIEEVNSYLPEIETNLERLSQSPDDMDALEEIYRRTHTIGGSASMMDFPGLAHVAHGMEDILGDVLDGLTVLDAPTIGLLQRSLERVRLLLRGIHQGIDENAIIAEDDADYTQYRMMMEESKVQSEQKRDAIEEQSYVSPNPQRPESPMPSLDEMLASFRTPIVAAGEEVAWPEDPVPTASFEVYADQSTHAESAQSPGPEPEISEQPDALDVLIATSAHQPATQSSYPMMPTTPAESANEVAARTELQPSSEGRQTELAPASVRSETHEAPFSTSYNKMQEETRTLEVQATSFRNMVAQLRQTVSIIEMQRTEFRSFLDGSKDALDRMEEWAGQAMGLNLRNSPEQVRRYLPLSVMWVVSSKLKKILELLTQITNGAVTTDEQMHTTLQELEAAMEACGSAFQRVQADMSSRLLRQEPGWTPWEMRVSHEAGAVQERVTFERRGDPVVLRAEVETQVREELRHEYESRPFTQAARAELERQIRSEVLQELEAKRQLQARLSGSEKKETIQEIEARLRHEIEIHVRREFLDQLTARVIGEEPAQGASRSSKSLDQPAPISPADTLTVAGQTREARSVDADAAIPTQQSTVAFAQNLSSTQPGTGPTTADLPSATSAPLSTFGSDFGEEVAELFRLEAEEHLQAIGMRVAALEKSPADRDLIQGIRRATHTLKGAAGMMGFRVIADLCHISEDLLDSVMEGTTTIGPAVLSIVLDTAETLDVLITGGEKEDANAQAMVQALRARYIELLGERSNITEEELDTDLDTDEEPAMSSSLAAEVVDDTQSAEASAQRAARGDLSVRVRLQKLDELVNLFGELLVNRSILEERVERLVRLVADVGISSARLRDVGQKLETRFEAATLPSGRSLQVVPANGNQSAIYSLISNAGANRRDLAGTSHLAEFDELELDRYTEFHQLTRGLSEGISDMLTLSNEMEGIIRECESVFARESRLSNTFQDRLLKARLVPLSTMKPRLYRAARSVALKQQKEFEFLVEGEATEIDRTVSEEIAGPLLHLVRNAVNHGIETPEVRRQKGKSPVGQIKLSAAYEGNQVVITVRDDGTGIDSEGVRNAAISHGFIKPDQLLHDNDLIGLIFQPGFSTAGVLSEESGRGVGLDVVRDSVARLRGTLEVESMPGQGTAFTMKFPTSLAIQSAMIVNAGGQQFAIPMMVVEAIGRLDTFKRSIVGGRPTILVQNESYPVTMLALLLGLSAKILDEKAQLLLVNAGGHKVALVVDEIKGRMDVVMKNLGPHLRHVRGVAGGTVLGNGRVVLILELVDLITSRPGVIGPTTLPIWREGVVVSQGTARSSAALAVAPDRRGVTVFTPSSTRSAAPERGKYILVVDDSPSVRRVVSNMLKQHGWQVQMARDGVEALEMITIETPAAVLLDIEMPRMDGYELMATVRAQDQYRTLPLVILTSRAAAKHQQRAMQLGASAYVVKPYQDEELINTLNALVYGAATS